MSLIDRNEAAWPSRTPTTAGDECRMPCTVYGRSKYGRPYSIGPNEPHRLLGSAPLQPFMTGSSLHRLLVAVALEHAFYVHRRAFADGGVILLKPCSRRAPPLIEQMLQKRRFGIQLARRAER